MTLRNWIYTQADFKLLQEFLLIERLVKVKYGTIHDLDLLDFTNEIASQHVP